MVLSEKKTCFLYRGILFILISGNLTLFGNEIYRLVSRIKQPLPFILFLLLNSNIVSTLTNVIVGIAVIFLSFGDSKNILSVFSYVFVPIIMFLVNLMPGLIYFNAILKVVRCLIHLKWEFTELSITSLVVSFLLTVSGVIFVWKKRKFDKFNSKCLMTDISTKSFTFEETKWEFSEELKKIEYIELTDEDSVNL